CIFLSNKASNGAALAFIKRTPGRCAGNPPVERAGFVVGLLCLSVSLLRDRVDLEHLVAEVVDDLHRDLARLRRVERLARATIWLGRLLRCPRLRHDSREGPPLALPEN